MRRSSGGLLAASVLMSWLSITVAINVTRDLSPFSSYSVFNNALTSTGVADEINGRSSITVLAVPNSILNPFLAANANADPEDLANLLRYHILLQYLDIPELQNISPTSPAQVTTLLQTTGLVDGNEGTLNITNSGGAIRVGLPIAGATPNATIVNNITQTPYNISILQIDSVLVPLGWGTRDANAANITDELEAAVNYKIFSQLLTSTGVINEFAAKQSGSGITIFAPTDAAFAALPSGALATLTPTQVRLILLYHALNVYYPLGTLATLNRTEPTLASALGGASSYQVDVSPTTVGGVQLNTGVSSAIVGSTLYDEPPTSIFSIGAVLLPPEIFAAGPASAPVPGVAPVPSAPVPVPALVPALAPAPSDAGPGSRTSGSRPGTGPDTGHDSRSCTRAGNRPRPTGSTPEEPLFPDEPAVAPAPANEGNNFGSSVIVNRVMVGACALVCALALAS